MKSRIYGKTIDIIVPVWNAGKYVNDFFNNIFKQTFQDFIVHIGYDESSDDTKKKIDCIIEEHPDKVLLYSINDRGGQGKARDYVLDHGVLKGDYIIFLDIDDYTENDFLEKMLYSAVLYDADLVICGLECFDDETGTRINVQMTSCPENLVCDIASFVDIAYMNCAVWNKLYRSEIVKQVRFGRARAVEDGIFLLKILPLVKRIKFINEPLYHYRVSRESAQARLTPEKFLDCWNYYSELAELYKCKSDIFLPYYRTFELTMFIKCCLGLTHRVAFKDLKRTGFYEKYSREKMDELAPLWRTNKNLQIKGWTKRNIKQNIVAVCAFLYKIHLFRAFIYAYYLFKKLTIKDVRW